MGNPGSGKSTILNGIAGAPIFKAGIALGRMTTALQRHDIGTLSLFDTPGLSDIDMRKKAGEELDALLQTNMNIHICFVVTLENGRPRPVDAMTIDTVLSSIKSVDMNNRFGVVINQLSKKVLELLDKETEKATKVRNGLTGNFRTSYWQYVTIQQELNDAEDGQLMTMELGMFLSSIPTTKPQDAKVTTINTDTLEEMQHRHEDRIQELQREHNSQIQDMIQAFEEDREEARRRERESEEQFEKIKEQYEEMQNRYTSLDDERNELNSKLAGMDSSYEMIMRHLQRACAREVQISEQLRHLSKRKKPICVIN